MATYPYFYDPPFSYSLFYYMLPILALIGILAGGLALYFLFVRKPNNHHGSAAKLHDILSFRKFFSEQLIRMLYCIVVIALIVYSIILLFSHVFLALVVFIVGNIIARVGFECMLVLLVLCRNTQEINRKMGPLPEETAPQQPAAPQSPVPPAPPQNAPAAPQPPVPPAPQSAPAAPQNPVPPAPQNPAPTSEQSAVPPQE